MGYHDDTTAVSNSMLKTFARSPALYRSMYITEEIPRPEPTPEMALGSLTHSMWLQPETVEATYAVKPKCDRRTTEGKKVYAEFLAGAGGKIEVDQEQYALAKAMVEALNRNEQAAAILAMPDRVVETPIRWTYELGAITLKAKPDFYAPGVCMDLKTALNPGPDEFAKQCANLAYYRQAAYYLDGCTAEYSYSDAVIQFLLVVVGKDAPHDVYVYNLGSEWIEQGACENAELLDRLMECQRSGVWQSPAQLIVSQLPMPGWLKYKS